MEPLIVCSNPMGHHATSLITPLTEAKVRQLHAGDAIRIDGTVFTGRDRFHRFAADGGVCPAGMQGAVLYHCGPIVTGTPGQWKVVAAGPTTSMREEPYMKDVIARFGIRIIIGKGGMGADTLDACSRYGCVYVQVVGGAAQFLGQRVVSVEDVHFLKEFGPAEAVWQCTVRKLPGIVTMDSHGRDLYAEIRKASRERHRRL